MIQLKSECSRVAVSTLGCKVNQAESEELAHRLAAAGYKLVDTNEPADFYILNTCTVTQTTDAKARQWLRQIHRRNPAAIVIATGCYAERAATDLSGIDGVKIAVSNNDKDRLVELMEGLKAATRAKQVWKFAMPVPDSGISQDDDEVFTNLPTLSRTRTFIKVQDGCRSFCSYCIVPLVRSHPESVPPRQVIDMLKLREVEGYKEAIITGVEVGTYESDGIKLIGLLERILTETTIPRLRLSSLQPFEITPQLLGLWENSRLCRHFHLSLQSGSDTVLQRMRRHYTTAEYARAVALIRAVVPDVAITTDVIVGFPGETDAEFAASYDFCQGMAFARVHVFPYSPRPGTAAVTLTGQVRERVKKARAMQMLALASKAPQTFRHQFANRSLPVLFEQKKKGLWSGLTDNYIRVQVESEDELRNKVLEVIVGEESSSSRLLK